MRQSVCSVAWKQVIRITMDKIVVKVPVRIFDKTDKWRREEEYWSRLLWLKTLKENFFVHFHLQF